MPDQPNLLTEQILHLNDNLNAKLKLLEELINHMDSRQNERIESLRCDIKDLRTILTDHELRLRSATDGVTQFKTWSGLSGGGSLIISAAALIRSIFGG